MPRQARIVAPGVPHHVTQRGNRRQRTFFRDGDYRAYLQIAAEAFREAAVEVWAYCLMPNHVHLIATPRDPEGLAQAVGATHLRYTRMVNRREGWTGYLWQGRFTSFPMDESHFITCARYVGLNPVRAGLTASATAWPWSSVQAHLGRRGDRLLTPEPLAERLGDRMAEFFETDVQEEVLRRFRNASSSGRPLGAAEWIKSLEKGHARPEAEHVPGRS